MSGAASALAAGNAGGDQTGQQQQADPNAGTIAQEGEKPWIETAGVDPKFHEAVTAKGWTGVNDVLDSYVNVEKLVSLERGGDVDRILVRPKDDATPEEIAAFRQKAGFSAPAAPEDYGFTAEQVEQAPILGDAAKWFHAAGVPKEMASALVEQVMQAETANVTAFQTASDTEYQQLAQQMGDKFADFEEAGRRAFRASGLEAAALDKIEMAIGTKAMLNMFAKFGQGMSEAAAPQPGRGAGGQFAATAESAKARIATLQKDSDFQAKLLSTNPEVRKAANTEWEELFKRAYPE